MSDARADAHTREIDTETRAAVERIAAALKAIEEAAALGTAIGADTRAGIAPCPCCGTRMKWTKTGQHVSARCETLGCIWFMS